MRSVTLKASLFALALCLPFAAHAGTTTDHTRPETTLVHEGADGDTTVAAEENADDRVPSSMKDPVLSNGEGAQAPADMHVFRDRHWE